MNALLLNKIQFNLLNITANQIHEKRTIGWWIFNKENFVIGVHFNTAKTKEEVIKILKSVGLLNYLKKCNNQEGVCDKINLLGKEVFICWRSTSLFAITTTINIHV